MNRRNFIQTLFLPLVGFFMPKVSAYDVPKITPKYVWQQGYIDGTAEEPSAYAQKFINLQFDGNEWRIIE